MVKKRILIIEDEPEVSKLLQVRLQVAGYATVTAKDGMDGWNKLNYDKPDLIIMDIMMPKLDGFSLCKLVKENKKTKDIPVIMLTAKSMISDIDTGFDMGAVSFITKPYDWERLLQEIKKFI